MMSALDDPLQTDPAVVERLKNAQGMCWERFALCQTLPLDEFRSLADALGLEGYRPNRVRPYLAAGKILVAAVWIVMALTAVRARSHGRASPGQKNEEFRREWEIQGQGFLPVDIACYHLNGR